MSRDDDDSQAYGPGSFVHLDVRSAFLWNQKSTVFAQRDAQNLRIL